MMKTDKQQRIRSIYTSILLRCKPSPQASKCSLSSSNRIQAVITIILRMRWEHVRQIWI